MRSTYRIIAGVHNQIQSYAINNTSVSYRQQYAPNYSAIAVAGLSRAPSVIEPLWRLLADDKEADKWTAGDATALYYFYLKSILYIKNAYLKTFIGLEILFEECFRHKNVLL